MIVLSHRGLWSSREEQNTLAALRDAFAAGFGAETDVRDRQGRVVLSHDMAQPDCAELRELFALLQSSASRAPLALNVKADSLQAALSSLLCEFSGLDLFFFDMSVPDAVGYLRAGLPAFTRQSEYESSPPYYEQAQGVWMDEFHGHWITREVLAKHVKKGKRICLVSPELHGRELEREWEDYRNWERELGKDRFMLCTDRPQLAKEFFDAN